MKGKRKVDTEESGEGEKRRRIRKGSGLIARIDFSKVEVTLKKI